MVRDWYGKKYYINRRKMIFAGQLMALQGQPGRGRVWFTWPWGCRSAYRDAFSPTSRKYDLGFRVVRSVTSK